YGTASSGAFGYGTVFKLTPRGTYDVLYSFTNVPDGATPEAGLVRDSKGNLYGTTASGGAFGYGTVFKVDTTGTEIILHSFSGTDGIQPQAGLVMDKAGNLYGTTVFGGASGGGTVFKLASLWRMGYFL
ncbi:MAG: Ig family protein, partial [Acidobacteria bacterium]